MSRGTPGLKSGNIICVIHRHRFQRRVRTSGSQSVIIARASAGVTALAVALPVAIEP